MKQRTILSTLLLCVLLLAGWLRHCGPDSGRDAHPRT